KRFGHCHGPEEQTRPDRGHRDGQQHPDRAVRGAGAGAPQRLRRTAAAGAFLQPPGNRDAVSQCADWRDRGRRRALQLVQGRSTDGRLRHDRDSVLFSSGSETLIPLLTLMSDDPTKSSKRVLEPHERISEVLFGLIMVLTFTGSLSIAEAGRGEVRTMLVGALGCQLAWGVTDRVLYLMGSLARKGPHLEMVPDVPQE